MTLSPFRSFVIALAISASFATHAAATEFHGEVLIAPPPPNWTGGTPLQTADGLSRVWRRDSNGPDGTTERVTILRGLPNADTDPSTRVDRWISSFAKACVVTDASTVTVIQTPLGPTAQATAVCDDDAGQSRHGRVMVLVGEFSSYRVERTWSGAKDNPGNPRDSQKVVRIWNDYFSRVSLCNTLTDACDPATAAAVHAHPRFKEMRSYDTADRPVLPATQVQRGAEVFGTLTGQAAACGEDVSPLLIKIGRMFAHVSANDAEASTANRKFESARLSATAPSGALRAEICGEIRRQFREHPSRIQGFARYIIGLI